MHQFECLYSGKWYPCTVEKIETKYDTSRYSEMRYVCYGPDEGSTIWWDVIPRQRLRIKKDSGATFPTLQSMREDRAKTPAKGSATAAVKTAKKSAKRGSKNRAKRTSFTVAKLPTRPVLITKQRINVVDKNSWTTPLTESSGTCQEALELFWHFLHGRMCVRVQMHGDEVVTTMGKSFSKPPCAHVDYIARCACFGNVYRHLDTGTQLSGARMRRAAGVREPKKKGEAVTMSFKQTQKCICMGLIQMGGFCVDLIRDWRTKMANGKTKAPSEREPNTSVELLSFRDYFKKQLEGGRKCFNGRFQCQGSRWVEYLTLMAEKGTLASVVRGVIGAQSWNEAVNALQKLRGVGGYSAAQTLCTVFFGAFKSGPGLFVHHADVMKSMISEPTGFGPGPQHAIRQIFGRTLTTTEGFRTLAELAPGEFKRLGLNFPWLKASNGKPQMFRTVDMEHILCYFSRYMRARDKLGLQAKTLYDAFHDPDFARMVPKQPIKSVSLMGNVESYCEKLAKRYGVKPSTDVKRERESGKRVGRRETGNIAGRAANVKDDPTAESSAVKQKQNKGKRATRSTSIKNEPVEKSTKAKRRRSKRKAASVELEDPTPVKTEPAQKKQRAALPAAPQPAAASPPDSVHEESDDNLPAKIVTLYGGKAGLSLKHTETTVNLETKRYTTFEAWKFPPSKETAMNTSGKLCKGDILVNIAGKNVGDSCTFDSVVAGVQSCKKPGKLIFLAPGAIATKYLCLHGASARIVLKYVDGDTHFIRWSSPPSKATATMILGELEQADVLVSVGNQDVRKTPFKEIVPLIRSIERPAQLGFVAGKLKISN
eukprot:g2411.t1